MEQVFEDSASCALELVRGSNSFSDTTPTIWIKGDCWPPYKEIVTRDPLRGAAKLNVFVDYVEGPSVLTFGLISPHDRSHMLDIQNKEHLRLTGNLWAWNSENRNIFSKPFDSKSRHGSMSQIVQFYDKDIGTGSVLCVYRDPKTNRIHFIINGKKGTVSFSSNAPDFCFGYVYLKSRGSSSEIQVSLQTVIDGGYFNPSTPVIEPAVVVEPVNTNPCFVIRVGQAISNVLSRFLPDLKAKEDHQAPASQEKVQEREREFEEKMKQEKKKRKRKEKLQKREREIEEKRKQEKKRLEEEIRDLEEKKLHLQNEILEQRNNLKSSQDKVQELEQIKKEFEEKRKQEKKNATELDQYEKEDGGREICFVINNFNFLDGRERRGAENDEKTMVDLFRNEIHFEVEVKKNLNGSEILKLAKDIATRDFTQYTQFVFIIMSHGDKDAIEGVDGAFVKVAQLMSQFSVRECETLRNKPKLFFIQACRGKLSDPRKDRLPTSLESTEGDGITRMLYPDSSLADGVTPLEADFVLSFATVPGYKAWRNQARGSWYIQELADVIRKNRHDHDLLEMLTEVNKKVAAIANEHPEFDLSFQVPAYSSTLRAKVFLS